MVGVYDFLWLDEVRKKLFPNPGTLVRLAAAYAVCAETLARDSSTANGKSVDYRGEAIKLIEEAKRRGFADEEYLANEPDLRFLKRSPGE